MDTVQADLTIIPKDCSKMCIPKLPCDSGDKSAMLNQPLAMAYVPMQCFKELNDHDCALQVGTIFKELDLPFCGIGGVLL